MTDEATQETPAEPNAPAPAPEPPPPDAARVQTHAAMMAAHLEAEQAVADSLYSEGLGQRGEARRRHN
jgi:hypothetical protein